MIINKNSKFALVGHGYHLFALYESFIQQNLTKPIIITHSKHLHKRDIRESKNNKKLYRDITELEKKTSVFYVKNFSLKIVGSLLKKYNIKYIFSCSSRFIFKKDIIDLYKNKIFNIHPTLLPMEKGGGTFTYRILNKNFFCCATIHLIDEGIDTGKILMQSKKKPLSNKSLPIDFLISTNKIYENLIKNFVKKISKEKKFVLKKQDFKNGTYLSRFYTDLMGAINWNWSGENINLFIQGCSIPYSGAFCFIYYKGRKFKIKIFRSKFIKSHNKYHEWFIGKIFYEDEKKIKVIVNNGYLNIDKKHIILPYKTNIKFEGKTFFNETSNLNKSLTHIPNVFKYTQ